MSAAQVELRTGGGKKIDRLVVEEGETKCFFENYGTGSKGTLSVHHPSTPESPIVVRDCLGHPLLSRGVKFFPGTHVKGYPFEGYTLDVDHR